MRLFPNYGIPVISTWPFPCNILGLWRSSWLSEDAEDLSLGNDTVNTSVVCGFQVFPWLSELRSRVKEKESFAKMPSMWGRLFCMMLQGYYMTFGMVWRGTSQLTYPPTRDVAISWVYIWRFGYFLASSFKQHLLPGMFGIVQNEAISTTLCPFGWTPGRPLVQKRGDWWERRANLRTWFYKYFPWMVKWSWKKSKV